jgi:hypothetical protein
VWCRRIRGWTGLFYERGVYVSMWVFVTPHLNPHRCSPFLWPLHC